MPEVLKEFMSAWCGNPCPLGGLRGSRRGRGGGTHVMHGRSLMAIDPRIHTMPGRSTSGYDRPERHCLHQAGSGVRCWAGRMKGELHLNNNRFWGGLAHGLQHR